jgi:hypothetical protein
MAKSTLNPEALFNAKWHELRTELSEWEDYAECYDGLTRYWCSEAVFEVYWFAEKTGNTSYNLYLTEDLALAGFNVELSEQPNLEWKGKLAEALCWKETATAIIKEVTGNQLGLFSE